VLFVEKMIVIAKTTFLPKNNLILKEVSTLY
jgi:hypothetical protein